jgi:hypothetical protein
VWREEGLRVPQRTRKRRRLGSSTAIEQRLHAERPNHVWAFDFQFDQTADGHALKVISADQTVAVLAALVAQRGEVMRRLRDTA